MSNIVTFAYRLTYDTGFAPCIENGILTLACCKGGQFRNGRLIHSGLRHTIGEYFRLKDDKTDVFLLGMYKNTLLFYAKINYVYPMSDYFSSSLCRNRTDNIYSVDESAPYGLVRNSFLPSIHPKIDPKTNLVNPQIEKDIFGDYVLYSTEFSYWGSNSKIIEDQAILDILPKYQESYPKRPYIDSANFNSIHNYVIDHGGYKLGKLYDPHNPIKSEKCKGCNQK